MSRADVQIPHGSIGDIYPIRRKSHWIRIRRRPAVPTGLIPQGQSSPLILFGSQLTLQQMTLEEGHKLALKTLKQVMEEKLDENNVQLAQVS